MSYFKNSKNHADFIGHLGNDVETNILADGTKVSKFSIGTTRVYKSGDNKVEEPQWIPCELWGDHPSLPYLKKGRQVSVDAFYKSSTTGEKEERKYFHVFRVTNVTLLGKGSAEAVTSGEPG